MGPGSYLGWTRRWSL